MTVSAIRIEGLTQRYGDIVAVRELDLGVPPGCVFGFLGPNGAGKTSTIRTVMNLLRPAEGRISVLGLDSVEGSLEIRRRVGYLPERPAYYGWMSVAEILSFNAAFYPTWDADLATALLRRFELQPSRRVGDLSRGMQAKVGLILALAARPELLVLDDPTSGLDPVVRREFLEEIVRSHQDRGGTVFFSTHILGELERVADEVAILSDGRLLLGEPVERLKRRFRKLRVVLESRPTEAPARAALDRLAGLDGVLGVETNGHHALITVADHDRLLPEVRSGLGGVGLRGIEEIDMSLEDVFVDLVRAAGPGGRR